MALSPCGEWYDLNSKFARHYPAVYAALSRIRKNNSVISRSALYDEITGNQEHYRGILTLSQKGRLSAISKAMNLKYDRQNPGTHGRNLIWILD